MQNREDIIIAELNRLRILYLERLPKELAELNQLAASMQSDASAAPILTEIHHRLHKLAGSGGSFGLVQLSTLARSLEQTAKARLEAGLEQTDPEFWTEFTQDVTNLRRTLSTTVMPSSITSAPSTMHAGDGQRLQHIWLVHENNETAVDLKTQLEQFGYVVTCFQTLLDASSSTASAKPDFLIYNNPASNTGTALTQATQQKSSFLAFGCPYIITSSEDDFFQRVSAARLGAAGFQLTPLDVPRLVALLEHTHQNHQTQNFRVMIVDDDESLSEHFRLTLMSAGMEVKLLNKPQDILQALSTFRPELVLLDISMPEFNGPEIAAVIRQHDEWLSLPIVYLSAETNLDAQIQALGQGADDFITKPISDVHLIAAVRVRVARARQLADQVFKDSLTGLLKHARIKEELSIELDRANREGRPLSVAMVDIDHFKSVNDTYGHAMGDRVIQAISYVLRQRLRKSDKIGRYGGEEFAIVLPGCDAKLSYSILEDIRERFAALSFMHQGGKFQCTFSAGIACSQQIPTADGNQLLQAADQALYAAKRANRNQVKIAQG